MPVTVWFLCPENHLCQVECTGHKKASWTRQEPRISKTIVKDPHLALATALEFTTGNNNLKGLSGDGDGDGGWGGVGWKSREEEEDRHTKNHLLFSICACDPCAGAMLIFSVSFQF